MRFVVPSYVRFSSVKYTRTVKVMLVYHTELKKSKYRIYSTSKNMFVTPLCSRVHNTMTIGIRDEMVQQHPCFTG